MPGGVQIGTAYIPIQGDWSGFNKDLSKNLAGAEGSFGRIGGKAKLAAAGVAAVAAGAALAGKALFDIGQSFDDAYDKIRVGTGATGKNLESLKRDFKDVVKTVPASFDDASTAIADLNTRLGLTGKPLRAVSTRILELSRITGTDVSQNIESVSRAFGDWGVQISKQPAALDKLFRASQATGVEVSKLSDLLVRYGAPLRQLGFGFEQSAALIGKFEKEGVNTQLVMGSLRIALGKLAKEGKDPVKAFSAMTEQIKNAGSAGEANGLALELFGARAGPDMAAAIREGRFELGDLYDTVKNGKETILGAAKDTQSFGEKWQLLKNRVLVGLEPVAIRVFDAVSAGMDQIIPAAQKVSQWVTALRGVFQGTGESSGRLSRILTSLKDAFQGIVDIAIAIKDIAVAAWGEFGDLVIDRAKDMLAFITAFTEGAAKALQGLVDLVAGVLTGDWDRAWQGIKDIFSGVWDVMIATVEYAWETIKTLVVAGLRLIKLTIEGFGTVLAALGKFIVNRIADGIRAAANLLADAAGWIKNRVVEHLQAQAEAFLTVGRWVLNRIADGVTTVTAALLAVGGWLKNRIVETVQNVASFYVGLGSWIVNRVADGFTTVTDAVAAVGGWLKNRIVDAVAALKKGWIGIGGTIIDWIVDGLRAGAKALVGFVNKLIGIINKIPGVDIGKVSVEGFAQGGVVGHEAFAKGGRITRPLVVVGEEAPRHDEYVIPTNPAYRGRALGLFGQLGSRLGVPGFRVGGVFSSTSYGPPWNALNGTGVTATGVDLRPARKAYGVAVDPGVIPLGAKLKINPNPFGHGGEFTAFDTGGAIKGNRIDFYDWRGRSHQTAWGRRSVDVEQTGKGLLSQIGSAVEDVLTAPIDLVKDLLGELPSPGDLLPGYLQGTGRFLIDKVTSYIKDKAGSLLGGGGSGGGGYVSNTLELANRVAEAAGLTVGSGYRDPSHNAAVGGVPNSLHTHGSPTNPGAWDLNGPAPNLYRGQRWAAEHIGEYLRENLVHDVGSGLHLHLGFFKKGGILGPAGPMPFVGTYHNGGVAPAEGYAHVLKGEHIGTGPTEVLIRVADDGPLRGLIRAEIVTDQRAAAGRYAMGVA